MICNTRPSREVLAVFLWKDMVYRKSGILFVDKYRHIARHIDQECIYARPQQLQLPSAIPTEAVIAVLGSFWVSEFSHRLFPFNSVSTTVENTLYFLGILLKYIPEDTLIEECKLITNTGANKQWTFWQ